MTDEKLEAREFTLESKDERLPPAPEIAREIAKAETLDLPAAAPAPTATSALPVGAIGSLRIGAEIGRGAQGVVYRASPVGGGADVAVKVLRAEASEAEVARFERAIDAVKALADVEGVVHVLGRGRSSWGSPFFTMELVQGPSLRSALEAGTFETRRLVAAIADVAWAIHEAHDRGVIHRDLKPENILLELEPDGGLSPRVADFGLARDLRSDEGSSTDAAGTPAYMAPEQVTGSPATRRTDIWALGAILYEVVAGTTPFKKPTAAAVARAILEEKPRPLATFWADLPESLAGVCARALEKDPDSRYVTAGALARDVERALRGETLGGTPIRPLRRRRRSGAFGRLLDAAGRALAERSGFLAGALLGVAVGVGAGVMVGTTEVLSRRVVERAVRPRR
jgi:serine/threonine protein kinase